MIEFFFKVKLKLKSVFVKNSVAYIEHILGFVFVFHSYLVKIVIGLPVAVSFDSLIICNSCNWSQEREKANATARLPCLVAYNMYETQH